MIRSGTVHTIHELATQGKPIRAIAKELSLARNTVRKYLRGKPAAVARPKRRSKLDPYKEQVRRWVVEDHLYNCVTMLPRLQARGYTGGLSLLKQFVHPLRPAQAGQRPVIRYETKPGEQLQFDWGEFQYEQDGHVRKVFGFTAILSYSRMRFVTFVKRTDAPTLVRCLLAAFEYFGGLPKAVLTDRMKTVLLDMETGVPHWHPLFSDLVASLAIAPRVCKAYTPQTKGKVERSIGVVKQSFWPGVRFTDVEDLNGQALVWCDQVNLRVHRTTHQRPVERLAEEGLRSLPTGFAWERFASEERKVSWEGYLSYDGVLYGLPSEPPVAGRVVHVRDRHGWLTVWSQGQLVVTLAKRARSGTVVPHPDQFRTVAPAAAARRATTPLGHQMGPSGVVARPSAPEVAQRPLAEYDQLYGVCLTGAGEGAGMMDAHGGERSPARTAGSAEPQLGVMWEVPA